MGVFDKAKTAEPVFFEKILDTTQTMIFWKDTERRFLGVNKAFLEYYGFKSQEELIGKTDEDMGWHSNPDSFQDDEWRVLHEGISTHMVHGKCMAKGEERDILASKGPVYENEEIVGLVGSFIDVTEQLRQQDKIAELTRKLDGIPGGIAIYRRYYGQLQCISANQCLAKMLGTTQQDLVGKMLNELMELYMEEKSRQRFLEECPVLDGVNRHASGTYRFVNQQTGKVMWLHLNCQLVREANGEELVYCVYANVDKLVRYEKELNETRHIAEKRYSRAMQMLNEGKERNVVSKGHYNFTRNEVLEYTTYTDNVYQFAPPMTYDAAYEGMMCLSYLESDIPILREKLNRSHIMDSFKQGEPHITVNYRRMLNDREPMWVQLVLQIFVMPDTGDIEGFSYAYDTTENVLKESIIKRMGSLGYDELGLIYTGSRFWRCYQYQDRQQWLHSVTHTSGDWDEELLRYARENIIPEQSERILRETSIPVIVERLAHEEVYSCPHTVKLPNGTVLQKVLKFSYLNSVHETIFYCLSDVTAQFERENEQIRELAEANHEVEQATIAKEAFFASMSHDMRTPLNGVIGYTDLALESDDLATVKNYLAKIRISGGLLLSLINDVLDFGKFVVKKITLKQEPIKIMTICNYVDTVIRPLAVHKNLEFTVENRLTYDGFLVGDSLRLQQLFVNLLSNSVKFTKSGGRVSISIAGNDAGDHIEGTIVIKDTGIGMSKEFLPLIFDPYSQEERCSASKTIGTGLGMAIVKQIVDLMGGSISIESEIDVGTAFTVKVALKKYTGKAIETVKLSDGASLEDLKGKKVLLCEDNELNAEITQLILVQWGMEMTWAENGQEAVHYFMDTTKHYDLILMDKRMPVMDGLKATVAIREQEKSTQRHIPIIAMTGDVDEASIQTCLDAGMDAHVGKPIDRDELIRVLLQYC